MVDQEIQNYVSGTTKESSMSNQTPYYMKVFQQIEKNHKEVNWNGSALIFGPFWMVYRRMYSGCLKILSIIIIFCLLDYFLEHFFSMKKQSYLFFTFIINFMLGINGNKMYYRHVRDQVKKGYKIGGVDLLTPLIILACLILVLWYMN
jgi:hypothetical protein